MISSSACSKNDQWYFWLFLIIHTLVWTLIPTLMRPTVTHDTLEGITWGLHWQLGYSKHPFLTAWLCAAVTQLFGFVGWPVYLAAQLVVSTTFFAVWKLAKFFIPATQAVIAALALDGVLFYNINSYNLTPDSLQSPLWALLALFFYQALNTQKMRYWIFSGITAALCFCTKYQALLLFLPMLTLCIINPKARESFKKPGFYCSLVSFSILITPHIIWLFHHQFISLDYAINAPASYTPDKNFMDHLILPVRFLLNNAISVLGLFVLFWPFYSSKKASFTVNNFQWSFLICLGLGPLFLTFMLCIITGDNFVTRWSTPYYFALGIIVLAYLKPEVSKKEGFQFIIGLIIFSSTLALSKIASLSFNLRPNSDAFLPNQFIAETLSQIWHEHYSNSPTFLAGSNYLVTGITPYMPGKVQTYINWNLAMSPWIDEKQMNKKGAIFIWDVGINYNWDQESIKNALVTSDIIERFPRLIMLNNVTFYRLSNHKPVVISIGLLPPQD